MRAGRLELPRPFGHQDLLAGESAPILTRREKRRSKAGSSIRSCRFSTRSRRSPPTSKVKSSIEPTHNRCRRHGDKDRRAGASRRPRRGEPVGDRHHPPAGPTAGTGRYPVPMESAATWRHDSRPATNARSGLRSTSSARSCSLLQRRSRSLPMPGTTQQTFVDAWRGGKSSIRAPLARRLAARNRAAPGVRPTALR